MKRNPTLATGQNHQQLSIACNTIDSLLNMNEILHLQQDGIANSCRLRVNVKLSIPCKHETKSYTLLQQALYCSSAAFPAVSPAPKHLPVSDLQASCVGKLHLCDRDRIIRDSRRLLRVCIRPQTTAPSKHQ